MNRRSALRGHILGCLLLVCVLFQVSCEGAGSSSGGGGTPAPPNPPGTPAPPGTSSYTTSFPLAENPISESGKWTNGLAQGLDWSDVATTPGKAFGTQNGSSANDNDSTAILTGTWGPNQTASATVFATGGGVYGEVELRLRSAISPHNITGYEINFSASYCEIVKWLGPLDSFTILSHVDGVSVNDGAEIKATIVGNTLTAYINGTQVNTATDSSNPYTTGNPGIGMFWQTNKGGTVNAQGLSSFTATDSSSP